MNSIYPDPNRVYMYNIWIEVTKSYKKKIYDWNKFEVPNI